MVITVYADVLFAVNFLINILIIEGTGVIINEETAKWRSIASAAAGALYAVLTFFPSMKFATAFLMKVLLSLVLVFIAFSPKGKRQFVKIWGCFYLVSFIFGGGIMALISMTDVGAWFGGIYSNGSIYLNLPWEMLFFSGAMTYFMIYIFGRIRKKRIARAAVARWLTISVNGIICEMRAIIDTGNSLTEPISGVPVIVCEYDKIRKIIPDRDGVSLLERMKDAGLRVRLVPFSGIGCEKGILPAFLPDSVRIDECEATECVVGISEMRLSGNEDYHALLNPTIGVKQKG